MVFVCRRCIKGRDLTYAAFFDWSGKEISSLVSGYFITVVKFSPDETLTKPSSPLFF